MNQLKRVSIDFNKGNQKGLISKEETPLRNFENLNISRLF